jgi:PAS domain S-box-containing protein
MIEKVLENSHDDKPLLREDIYNGTAPQKETSLWKIIIADDQEEVHNLTKMVLSDFTFEGRGLEFLSAYSGQETKRIILEHSDTAIILLDVVMETDHAGLEVVHYIRKELKNDIVQIVLRTGQSGRAPEQQVIVEYGINDYKSKVELTSQKLFTMVTALLRTYKLSSSFSQLNRKLQKELMDRKIAEKALKESEARYRILAETTREIIITYDSEEKITYMNKAGFELGGYKETQILGENIASILEPESTDNDNKGYFYNARFLKESKDSIPVEVTSSILKKQGAPTGTLVTARDITAKIQAEGQARLRQEQLFQAAKMASLGTLVSGVAHEINNPITSVMLNAPILGKVWSSVTPLLDKICREDGDFHVGNMSYSQLRELVPVLLSDIEDGAMRVKGIVGDLKDFARQTPSEMNDVVDINTAVSKAIALVKNLIKKSTNHLLVDYGENLPQFKGNAQRMEQVVINLLVNSCQALKDSEQSLKVTTGHNKRSSKLVVEIRDKGVGMPPEVLKRIKDPFFTTKRDDGGTGLGLSISDRIIQDHGGTIEFSSQSNKGTTVKVSLPITSNNNPGT